MVRQRGISKTAYHFVDTIPKSLVGPINNGRLIGIIEMGGDNIADAD